MKFVCKSEFCHKFQILDNRSIIWEWKDKLHFKIRSYENFLSFNRDGCQDCDCIVRKERRRRAERRKLRRRQRQQQRLRQRRQRQHQRQQQRTKRRQQQKTQQQQQQQQKQQQQWWHRQSDTVVDSGRVISGQYNWP